MYRKVMLSLTLLSLNEIFDLEHPNTFLKFCKKMKIVGGIRWIIM